MKAIYLIANKSHKVQNSSNLRVEENQEIEKSAVIFMEKKWYCQIIRSCSFAILDGKESLVLKISERFSL